MDASWLPMASFLATRKMELYMGLEKKFGESLIDDELQKLWTVADHH